MYRRKQGYDYGEEINSYKPTTPLEYKGYFNPNMQDFSQYHPQQQFDNGNYKQEEPLALFVSKPEEQNFIKQQPAKAIFDNNIGKLPPEWLNNGRQEFQPVLQKPPQHFNYNQQSTSGDHQQKLPIYPPNDFQPGLKQLPQQQPMNFYVGFDNVQQPAEAAKQNFDAFNLPKLQQPPHFSSSQQQKYEPDPGTNHALFGGHFLEPGKRQQHQQQQQQNFETQQPQISYDEHFKNINNHHYHTVNQQSKENLFNQIPSGNTHEFKKPSEQSMIKFSNEDAVAVQPQEVGKIQFGKGSDFNFGFGMMSEGKRDKEKKKKRSKRFRTSREPQYTYIIRARKHRE